ncbi:MAG TPA: DinB family protein, partial [Caldilineaceae bacterium]|nr:DinB family protein [Caldilineaceae bacterium]
MKSSILAELEAARLVFHALLDSLSEEDLQRASANPAWSNRQILFHMLFGFLLLPSLLGIALIFSRLPSSYSRRFAALLNRLEKPFNVINALGPQGGGRVFTRQGLRSSFDWVHTLMMKWVQALPEAELQRGMYYPARWDPLFRDYMTIAEILRFPMR